MVSVTGLSGRDLQLRVRTYISGVAGDVTSHINKPLFFLKIRCVTSSFATLSAIPSQTY